MSFKRLFPHKITVRNTRGVFFKSTHRFAGGLALGLVLRSGSRHLLSVTIRNVDQDTGTLLTAVGATDVGKPSRELKTERRIPEHERYSRLGSLPKWLEV